MAAESMDVSFANIAQEFEIIVNNVHECIKMKTGGIDKLAVSSLDNLMI